MANKSAILQKSKKIIFGDYIYLRKCRLLCWLLLFIFFTNFLQQPQQLQQPLLPPPLEALAHRWRH